MDRVKIGLVGFGTVGESFYRLAHATTRRSSPAGWASPSRCPGSASATPHARGRSGPGTRVVQGWQEIVDDPDVPIVVELAGGVDNPLPLIREALTREKHVITANKALLSVARPGAVRPRRRATAWS